MLSEEWDNFIAQLQALEDRAHRLGLTLTAQAINAAKDQAGWEYAWVALKEETVG